MTTPQARRSLLTLLSMVTIDLIGFGVVIPILPFYAEAYGASATVLGVLLTSYAAMQFLFAPLWGRFSDRFGRRRTMLLTLAGTGLALTFLGFASSLWGLFAARILGGVFAANVSVATAYITDLTPEEERTRWMGLIGAAFGVGFLLGPGLGGALAPLGYAVPIRVAAVLAGVNWIYAFFVLREPERHRPRDGEHGASSLTALGQVEVRRLCVACFIFTCAVSQLETVFAFFMMDRFGYDARHVAFILVAMALIMAVIQGGLIRSLAHRFGERRLLLCGGILLAGAFAAVPWARPVSVLMIPLAISAVGRAIAHPSMLSLVSSAADEDHRGTVMGSFQASASLARVFGPVVAGLLYDRHLALPFLVASLLMAVVVVLTTRLRPRLRNF